MRRVEPHQVLCFVLLFMIILPQVLIGRQVVNNLFRLELTDKGIVSLQKVGDPAKIEFIRPGQALGPAEIRYRIGESPIRTLEIQDSAWQVTESSKGPFLEYQIGKENGLEVKGQIRLQDSRMLWQLTLENTTEQSIEVGDMGLPLWMNTFYEQNVTTEEHFSRRLFKHAYIAGHGSWLFWIPVRGQGTSLVMVPDNQTSLEYFDVQQSDYARGCGLFCIYVHSKFSTQNKKGSWRQPSTNLILPPGGRKTYGFNLLWAESYDMIREILYQEGGFDIRVVPGMVVPEDLTAKFSLRTQQKIEKIVPEYPDKTRLNELGLKGDNQYLYEVSFSKLGENLLTVHYGNGRTTPMEFFVTQPLETLIHKRAAFISQKQQHRDASKWYNGLYSLWDVRNNHGQNLLGPDNLSGQHKYAVSGSDDPSNSKCIYLSEKNVAYPDPDEIKSLEYFLENFVWGKHQRTDQEYPYPYGIYGSDSWNENRFASRDPLEEGVSRPGGPSQCRMWRSYDYTTYFALYYNMYKIAKQNPDMVQYLDAAGYLERAFGTAKAYFDVPRHIRMDGGWAFTGFVDWMYTTGNFHEKYLLPLMESLEEEGQKEKAEYLRGEWEKKVKYFLYDDPYPFVSEMPVDSTAYETSYVVAKYAMENTLLPDQCLWQNPNTGRWYCHPKIDPSVHHEFMNRQLWANLACRGVLETSYYHLGSDFRASGSGGYTLSYMSQLGGWAVLDYAIYFAQKPAEMLRLGYASMLSSWALVNAGSPESNYGYWYPGSYHDGAVGWGFSPQQIDKVWNQGCWDTTTGGMPRGAWPVDGEIDHGLVAGIEGMSTVVYDDPIFGWFAFGGNVAEKGGEYHIYCRDGVRQRFHWLNNSMRLHLTLNRDGFDPQSPVIIEYKLNRLEFSVESRTAHEHNTEVAIKGLLPAQYEVWIDSQKTQTVNVVINQIQLIRIPMGPKGRITQIRIRKIE